MLDSRWMMSERSKLAPIECHQGIALRKKRRFVERFCQLLHLVTDTVKNDPHVALLVRILDVAYTDLREARRTRGLTLYLFNVDLVICTMQVKIPYYMKLRYIDLL